MRRTVSLLVALFLLALAVPSAAPAVDRKVATTPDTGGQAAGYQRAWRFSPSVSYQTWIPAYGYAPDISKPWFKVNRPETDLYAADAGARHFWPGCSRQWYGVNDQRSAPGGFYYTFYHVNC